MKKKWLGSAATVSMLAAIMLAGCGSTDTSSTEKNDAPSKDKEIKIGMTQIVEHPSLDAASKGFKAALEEKGLKAEFDMQIAGDPNNTQTVANNFVSDKVDLIFANSTPSALGALNATKDIPVVFTSVTDPLGAKLVSSMEAPGGNVTGTTDTHPDAIPKTVEFIAKQMKAKKVGTIYNAGEQNSVAQVEIVKKEMKKAGIELAEASVSTSAEVKQAAESLAGKVDAFYVITDNTVVSALESVIGVANDKDIPLFVGELDSVARGGFAAYGFDYYDIGFEAGEMAAQILQDGKKPEDLPVQYPQKLKLSINEKAAKEMGIEIKEEWKSEAEIVK
ncbi:ABC transporter substrate-binding protein [Peribacillus saganii]|uniref:ABC transporter substrate-binding protein n=1 Tax=Peribacillus saganii TaxID=2303992 RepID=A0A372LCA6_9BACI|nr:ABC transporter substrate-binding protein [Peribacillus saganii]RFU63550.1 ABC transporter substrate-binding protein [Peribacillus saganii]